MHLSTRKMAEFDIFRRLFAFQLIFVTIGIISVETSFLNKIKSIGGTVGRSIVKVPSKIVDGSQYTTQRVGRTLRSIKPIEGIVDKTCGPISNILGTSSRLLGKTVKKPQEVVFLYGRIHKDLGTTHPYQEIVKEVIGYVLTNVILYQEDMADSEPVKLTDLPVLSALITNYKTAGATPQDVYHLLKLLSRNGKQDIPKELAEKMENYSIMTNSKGEFKTSKGLMDELRWIGEHPNGFYKINRKDRTDYKMNANTMYNRYAVIHPPIFENTENE